MRLLMQICALCDRTFVTIKSAFFWNPIVLFAAPIYISQIPSANLFDVASHSVSLDSCAWALPFVCVCLLNCCVEFV